jgi:hypothetical protein
MMPMNTRAAAAKCLASVLGGKSLNQALPPLFDKFYTPHPGVVKQQF